MTEPEAAHPTGLPSYRGLPGSQKQDHRKGPDVTHVKITDVTMASAKILLDGMNVAPVTRAATFHLRVGEVPTLDLDLVVIDMPEVDGEAAVVIPDETRDVLIALGWTPPVSASPAPHSPEPETLNGGESE